MKQKLNSFWFRLKKAFKTNPHKQKAPKEVVIPMLDNDINTKHLLLESLEQEGEHFYSSGFGDGLDGLNPEILKVKANAKANKWQAYLEANYYSKLMAAQLDKQHANLLYTNAKTKHAAREETFKEKLAHYRFDPRAYKLLLGCVYILIAIVLIVADWPLSIQIVEEGFKIASAKSSPGFWGMMKPIESKLLAAGIVMVMLYVKIYYNKYLDEGLHLFVTRFTSEANLPQVNKTNASTIKTLKLVYASRWIIHTAVLAGLCFLIYTIGEFRYEVLYDRLTDGGTKDPSKISTFLTKEGTAKTTFIWLGFMLPIVSAIFAAVGSTKVGNFFTLKKMKRDLKRSLKKFAKAAKTLNEKEKLVGNHSSYLKWVTKLNSNNNNAFIEYIQNYFYACYMNGYQNGLLYGSPNKDLFEYSLFMRDQFLNRRVTHQL